MIFYTFLSYIALSRYIECLPVDKIGDSSISTVTKTYQMFVTTEGPIVSQQQGLTTISTIIASDSLSVFSDHAVPTAIANTIPSLESYNANDYFTVTRGAETCLYYYETVDDGDDDIYETLYSYSSIYVTEVVYMTSFL